MWEYYNPSPTGRTVGDCSVRALSKALDVDWERAYALTAFNGFLMGDMSDSNSVWGSVLRQHGFTREVIPSTCPDCYTFADFAADHPIGTYVVCTGTHVASIIDGVLYDSWDSSNEIVQYVWIKGE